MSQMVTRQRTGGDEKEKRTDSPVKEMKKKMAANAEKEKNAVESTPAKSDKPVDKPADKPVDKAADKPKDKPADKKVEKAPEKPTEKKPVEKKDGQSEKKKEENGKGESSGKPEKATNGRKQNGNSNGMNGDRPSSDSDSLVVDEADETELFPELAYDDSDGEWEGQDVPRSLTRRDQVKATRTPETPRPASDKQDPLEETKTLKLQDGAKTDTPKSDKDKKTDAKSKSEAKSDAKDKKSEAKSDAKDKKSEVKSDAKDKKSEAKSDAKDKKSDTKLEANKTDAKQDAQELPKDAKKDVKESPKKSDKKEEKSDKVEFEVVVEIENSAEPAEESRKPDTNFSKSRVKVSPYRRSMRLADQTTSSIAANYTGNNTTMEMDITESSSFMEESLDDSYLSGLRSIKGRRSYKPLKEMSLRSTAANRSVRSITSITTMASEHSSRPTAPVVGRKRKPEQEPELDVSVASEADELPAAGKRQRLLERLARPFRRTALLPITRNPEIVGINTDLPLTAPVASTSSYDPESLKAAPLAPEPLAPPAGVAAPVAEDAKRCVVM